MWHEMLLSAVLAYAGCPWSGPLDRTGTSGPKPWPPGEIILGNEVFFGGRVDLAERAGFEPAVQCYPHAALAKRCDAAGDSANPSEFTPPALPVALAVALAPGLDRVALAWDAMPEAIRAAVLALASPYSPAGIITTMMNTSDAPTPTPKPVSPTERRRPSPRQRPRWKTPLTPSRRACPGR